jgi:hypothetical protein
MRVPGFGVLQEHVWPCGIAVLTQPPGQRPRHGGRRPYPIRPGGQQEDRAGNLLHRDEGTGIFKSQISVTRIRQGPAVQEPRGAARRPAARHDVSGHCHQYPVDANA